MATTDMTTISPLDPLLENFGCYNDDHHSFLRHDDDSCLDNRQVSTNELINKSSGHSNLATSPISSLSSASSMQTSRHSLHSLWNSNVSSEHISSPIDSSSTATSLWSYSLGDLPPAYTTTCESDQKKKGMCDLQQQRQQYQSLDSLSQTPYHPASYTQTTPSFLNQSSHQTEKQQWRDPKVKPTNSCVDWPSSSGNISCHPFRNIWSASSMEQQQPSHQRRFSLFNDRVLDNSSEYDARQR
ncbi:hypothetical protein BCR42DRAFT_197422 [Absidia repens]|uniref:Uncharacterized protein n=1 Tax=Absidia repens TaxID=90262 RepID=A0A1X2IT37_9FUNG|nr:hypothetical protein BCR42DRAFT_197422 [Absidia repens]